MTTRLEWGADPDTLWGADPDVFWGAVGDAMPDADTVVPPLWFHALVKVDLSATETLRFWTGVDDLEFEEDGTINTWVSAGQTLEVGGFASHAQASDDRLVIGFNALRPEYRDRWLVPVGPLPVEVRTLASENYGISWTILPQVKRGVMSNPRYEAGVYRFDVVHPFEARQAFRPLTWSHEDQIARYPGDTGLAFMRAVASGVESEWPHVG